MSIPTKIPIFRYFALKIKIHHFLTRKITYSTTVSIIQFRGSLIFASTLMLYQDYNSRVEDYTSDFNIIPIIKKYIFKVSEVSTSRCLGVFRECHLNSFLWGRLNYCQGIINFGASTCLRSEASKLSGTQSL